MTIGREYYDNDGNYWQIETPYYIPPEDAIKHPEYVRGCIKAKGNQRKNKKYMHNFYVVSSAILILLLIALVVIKKGVI